MSQDTHFDLVTMADATVTKAEETTEEISTEETTKE